MLFYMPGNRTLDKISTKYVFVRTTGHDKMHFTVVLCCLQWSFSREKLFLKIKKSAWCHQKGWMDEKGILFWLSKIWDRRPGALLIVSVGSLLYP